MDYQYSYRNTTLDFWQLSMCYIYGAITGVCNIIFTAAVLILAVVRWESFGVIGRVITVIAACLFPILQPFFVYIKARKQAAAIKEDTTIQFTNNGIFVTVGEKHETIKWKSIKRVSKKPTMLIVFSDTTHGFVLHKRVLGQDMQGLYAFITSKMVTK